MSVVRSSIPFLVAGLIAAGLMVSSAATDGPTNRSHSTDRQAGASAEERPGDTAPKGNEETDAKWGDLKMRFVYDGMWPGKTKVPIPATHSDRAYCARKHPLDESLIVDPMSKGIANVVVWLYLKSDDKPPQSHPDYAVTVKDRVRIDNLDCRFVPHICLLRTSQQLIVGNKDRIGHNVKIDFFSSGNRSFSSMVAPITDDDRFVEITEAERIPVNVVCSVHPWMTAKLVVKDHPYFAVSNKNGELVIRNVPTGDWTFQAWQEKSGYLNHVAPSGERPTWKARGRFEVGVTAGENDLGTLKVAPKNFE